MTAISSRFLFELPGDANMVKYDSPEDILNGEDYGDGKRLVRETVADYEEYDAEYDVEYDDEPPAKKKKKAVERKRHSIMTGEELLQKKKRSKKRTK